MKTLVAFDSFKGSLSATNACNAFRKGILDVNFDAEIQPLADGGEGTAEILAGHYNAQKQTSSQSAFYTKKDVAIADMASVNPWESTSPDQMSILDRNSYKTGELIKAAFDCGARKLFLGLGGSGTHDAGIGMLKALGFRFFDLNKNEIEAIPRNLQHISDIKKPEKRTWPEIIALCDVNVPLLGSQGSVQYFAEQKGANKQERNYLEKGFIHLAQVLGQVNLANSEKTGAAGGMAFALKACLEAELVSGFGFLAKELLLSQRIKDVDCIVSGEGKLDNQSLNGKVIGSLLELCQKHNKPLFVVCGQSELSKEKMRNAGITEAMVLSQIFGQKQSQQQAADCLRKAGKIFTQKFQS